MKEKFNPGSNEVLIGIGSNIDPVQNITDALRLLGRQVTIRNLSSIYQSPAVGSSGPDYLNCAILIDTESTLDYLRKNILAPIENQLNRVRSSDKNMDRTIDLDVLIYCHDVTDNDLWSQAHVAIPGSELLPEFINKITGEKLSQAANRLKIGVNIKLRSDLLPKIS